MKDLLSKMVRDRKLSPKERLASRIGYMGAGLLIAAQWTIEPVLYVAGFICVLIQVTVRKQWNLVVLNVNEIVACLKHFFFCLLLTSCQQYEYVNTPLNYKDYQSSIDTSFNYLEDIRDWEGIKN